MGTRADFYIGRGQEAEWLGSVAWNGYEWDEKPGNALMTSTTPEQFKAAVEAIKVQRQYFTSPEQGWPWPWEDSRTTDYAYVLHDGAVTSYRFGRECFVNDQGERDICGTEVDWFPDMSVRKNVTYGERSGLIVMRA